MLKYQEVADQIELAIKHKKLNQGTRLPSLNELIAQYAVSKTTLIKALTTLEDKGIIYQVQGSGTFVRRQKREGYIALMTNMGFTKDLKNSKLSTKVIDLKIETPNAKVARELNCAPDEKIYFIKRIRYIDNHVLCIEQSYYRKKIVSYLNREIISDSIFNYLTEVLKLKIGFSDKYLQTDTLKETEAQLLELPKNSPGFYIDELFYTVNGEPFDLSQTIYNYKHANFFIQSGQK
ncbi:GntR family transcriptional regulator [Dellaglioa sp. BT-FLS60]